MAGSGAGHGELRRETLGALRPQAPNQGPLDPGPILGVSAGVAAGCGELRRGTLGALRPQAPNQGPLGPGPIFGCRPMSLLGGRQSRPEARKARRENAAMGREKTSFLPANCHIFPCPGACKLSFPTWRILFGFRLLPVRRPGCKGRASCRGVQGPRRPLLRQRNRRILSGFRLLPVRHPGCKGHCPLPQGTGAAEAPAPVISTLPERAAYTPCDTPFRCRKSPISSGGAGRARPRSGFPPG